MKKRFLHLDFKGLLPSTARFKEYLAFFRQCGYDGVVFEYDCRIKWDTWPGTAREQFTKQDIRELLDYAAELGFETIPLIQSLGHLEWALAKEQYADLREGEYIDEVCPLKPAAAAKIKSWIDEVMQLHPTSLLHIGADETWYLGSCPECRKAAENDPERGRMGGYVDFISDICRYVVAKGARPMIWADMFWRDERVFLAKSLPEETILVDWEYGKISYLEQLKTSGLEVWGASALQCGSYEHWWRLQNIPGPRIANAERWNQSDLNVIHTTWGRPGSLWNLYSPWASLVPVFAAAGNMEKWCQNTCFEFVSNLTEAIFHNWPHELAALEKSVAELPVDGGVWEEWKNWQILALQYQRMEKVYQGIIYGKRCVQATRKFLDADYPSYKKYYITPVENLQKELKQWEIDIREFFRKYQWSDVEEFVAEKMCIFEF